MSYVDQIESLFAEQPFLYSFTELDEIEKNFSFMPQIGKTYFAQINKTATPDVSTFQKICAELRHKEKEYPTLESLWGLKEEEEPAIGWILPTPFLVGLIGSAVKENTTDHRKLVMLTTWIVDLYVGLAEHKYEKYEPKKGDPLFDPNAKPQRYQAIACVAAEDWVRAPSPETQARAAEIKQHWPDDAGLDSMFKGNKRERDLVRLAATYAAFTAGYPQQKAKYAFLCCWAISSLNRKFTASIRNLTFQAFPRPPVLPPVSNRALTRPSDTELDARKAACLAGEAWLRGASSGMVAPAEDQKDWKEAEAALWKALVAARTRAFP